MGIDKKNFNGYIEGYYGKILSWNQRHRILNNLKKNDLSSYFYCPKEDSNHRLQWRKLYSNKWSNSFQNFCKKAHETNVHILTGISPGLDFNFMDKSKDFKILLSKARKFLDLGSKYIVLMFDDIPNKFEDYTSLKKTDGYLHAELCNSLLEKISNKIMVVPRVYADELIEHSNYLNDFLKALDPKIPIFYCGKNIVSSQNSFDEFKTIKKLTNNKIIIWDNLYANDYCPQKIFLGPWKRKHDFANLMVNLTGMIETDLFLLNLTSHTKSSNNYLKSWKQILKKYKIPQDFLIVCKYFFPLDYKNFESDLPYKIELNALDFLLWKWKTPLSREWYPFLLILKQNLQLYNDELSTERIKKVFPVPMYKTINKIRRI